MTDEQIIKALECCSDGTGKGIIPATLDLINRLQAKNENYSHNIKQLTSEHRKLQLEKEKLEIELKGNIESSNRSRNCAMEVIKKQQAENERLKADCDKIAEDYSNLMIEKDELFDEAEKLIKSAKAEAIKEFAERLKENICQDNDLYEKCVKHLLSIDYQQGYAEKNDSIIRDIDSLVKEMVGEQE